MGVKRERRVVYIGCKMDGSYIFLESTLKSRFATRGRHLCLRVILLLFLEFVPVFPRRHVALSYLACLADVEHKHGALLEFRQ